jgi:hypothetical protein
VSFRVWPSFAVAWGETLCEAPGCVRAAELLADFDEWRFEGVPVCCVDADLMAERWAALAENPAAGFVLPDPWEAAR